MVKSKDVHRLFKQAMISRRYVSEDLACILWKKSEEACKSLNGEIESLANPAEISDYIQEINETLLPLSIEFKSRIDEVSGKRIWAMVNSMDGDIAQMATDYSAAEINYFKAIIDLIVLAPADAFSVSSMLAIREVQKIKGTLSKAQGELTLRSFVANGWLYKTRRGRYALSSRALIELELYLRNSFGDDVPECSQCMELCTLGVACNSVLEESGCPTYLHRHCHDNLRRANPRMKCPRCESDWTQKGALRDIGEDSVPDDFDDMRRRKRKSVQFNLDEVEAEEGETEEEEEAAGSDRSPSPKPVKKEKGKLVRKSQLTQQSDDDD
ncbi:hypothetical protein FS842_000613 [Serendipita sp. 407]|nr:hypothetical protein FS842_000613 [Serendipita sp. 407]